MVAPKLIYGSKNQSQGREQAEVVDGAQHPSAHGVTSSNLGHEEKAYLLGGGSKHCLLMDQQV